MSKELEKNYNPSEIEDRLYQKWLDKKYFHAEALKLPVPHTDVLKPTSHKVFLRNYWNPKKLAANA